jgi:hypothetical protein
MRNESKFVIGCIISAFFLASCGNTKSKCGDNIDLGRVDITAETAAYFPYTGKEKIIIKNANNEELTLTRFNSLTAAQSDSKYESARPCDVDIFDRQKIVYSTNRFQSLFQNTGKRQMSFGYDAFANARGETVAGLGISDYMYINAQADSTKGTGGTLYSQFRGDTSKISPFDRKPNSEVNFVADTTIRGKNFKNVLYTKNTRHALYIAKGKGLIAMKFDDELWLVDRVE